MKAIFEVNFKLSDMIDKQEINERFNGDTLKAMKRLYKDLDMGMFNNKIRLIDVKK